LIALFDDTDGRLVCVMVAERISTDHNRIGRSGQSPPRQADCGASVR
jgi:hypothetical protein